MTPNEFVEVDAGSPAAQAAMTAYFAELTARFPAGFDPTGYLAPDEQTAAASGYRAVRLDTNPVLVEAIAMYRKNGYADVERYNDNPYAGLWFEKSLS